MTSPAPGTSSGPRSASDPSAGSTRPASTRTAMPIGTFTRKIQCQLKRPVSTPPRSTPTAPPPDITKPKTPIAFARSAGLGEQAHDQGEGDGRHGGATETLHGPADDQERAVGRQTTGDRAQGERDDAAEEDAAVAVEVTEPPAQQQEAAEGQHVGVDHPRQRGLAEAQVGLDGGQGDVHDVRVEHDHQVAQAEHLQGQPAGLACRSSPFSSIVVGGSAVDPSHPLHERCGPDTTARPNIFCTW